MKPSWGLLDAANLGDTVESLKAGLVPNVQRALKDIRDMMTRGITFEDNMLSSIVRLTTIVSGAELVRDNPRFRPIGFVPIACVSSAGVIQAITSWSFNASPSGSTTQHGITVTVVAGTIGTLTGILIGG